MITLDQVRELIRQGESLEIEFKRDADDTDLVEAVVCLANGAGGWLLIGVEDDGTIVGARPRHGAVTDTLRLASLIQSRTVPPVSVQVATLNVEGNAVIALRTPRMDRPVATSSGHFLRRGIGADGKPRCLPFYHHEMLSRGYYSACPGMLSCAGGRDKR